MVIEFVGNKKFLGRSREIYKFRYRSTKSMSLEQTSRQLDRISAKGLLADELYLISREQKLNQRRNW